LPSSIDSNCSGSPYHDANAMRRNSDVSAHSSIGDGSVLPHGVEMFTVIEKPSRLGAHSSDWTHFENFSSHVRPLFSPQAMPAARAAGVSVSCHLLTASHTCVRDVSVATARPL
jgi:hypothetical protein